MILGWFLEVLFMNFVLFQLGFLQRRKRERMGAFQTKNASKLFNVDEEAHSGF
jgi:hypothetical protein